jgi:hypothetical protein
MYLRIYTSLCATLTAVQLAVAAIRGGDQTRGASIAGCQPVAAGVVGVGGTLGCIATRATKVEARGGHCSA